MLEDFPVGSQIDVFSPYIGVPSTAFAAIDVQNCYADVNIVGGQLIGSVGGTTYGLRVLNSRGLTLYGSGILDFPNPVFLDGSTDCNVQPNVSNPSTSGVAYAVGLSGSCARSIVNPKVSGKVSAFPAAAVMLFTDSITDVRIQTERIDPSCVSGGRKLMLGSTNVPITTSGRYLGGGSADAAGTIIAEGLPASDTLIPLGKVIKVGGTQVLSARQTRVPNAAYDLASVINLTNFLRTALINHGAIS